MSNHKTSKTTTAATSSPVSQAGKSRSNSQAGRKTRKSGPGHAHASHGPSQVKEKDGPTAVMSGPIGTASSKSDDLQRSLANRLQAVMGVNGSMEFLLTWKSWNMPSREPICALRASAHRISDKGYGGWPTPNLPNGGQSIKHAQLKGGTAYHNGKKVQICLEAVARIIVSWTTPQRHDAQGRPNPQRLLRHGTKHGCRNLNDEVGLACWATPSARDWKSEKASDGFNQKRWNHSRGKPLSAQTSGLIPNTSHALTENRGALNPDFSRWLMGYPAEWEGLGRMVIVSSRKSPRLL